MVDSISPTEDTENQDPTIDNNNDNNTNSSGCVYDKYGRTPDKSKICAIGIKSAAADVEDGVIKCVFENKCAHCGQPSLMWGWKWDSDSDKVQKFDGTDGTNEGHIYCVMSEGGCDADFSVEGNEHEPNSPYKLTAISGPTPSTEEEAQQLSSGTLACDGSTVAPNGTSVGGGAVSIPDITFYGLIKQICGATDSLFVIANNMAYLLSFKDIYEYRNQFDKYIPTIEAKDVLYDTLQKDWSTNGYYNAVEITYADGIIKYQNDTLVKQYGENTFYYEFPEDDEETAKAKADALLASHIRDYSTDVQLSIFYNENITEGSWVKVNKTLTQISGKTRKEVEQDKIKKDKNKKVSTKRKGINITNLVEKTLTENNITKTIQTITDEAGDIFDIEVEKSEYELFFVQSYTCRWDKNNSLIMDLELKYGPDTPDDPVNATIGVSGSSNATVTGNEAADINEFVEKALAGVPSDDKSKVEAIYNAMVAVVRYDLYECSKYSTPSECLKNASHLNCADSSRLGRACYAAGGLQSRVVAGPGHFWVEVQVDGQWIGSDVTGPQGGACVRGLNEIYSNLTKTSVCGDEPSC